MNILMNIIKIKLNNLQGGQPVLILKNLKNLKIIEPIIFIKFIYLGGLDVFHISAVVVCKNCFAARFIKTNKDRLLLKNDFYSFLTANTPMRNTLSLPQKIYSVWGTLQKVDFSLFITFPKRISCCYFTSQTLSWICSV